MKKSKILVPALAVLALGMAGATTGTVAWFRVTNASIGAGAAASGTVKATTTSDSLGNFTVTPVLQTAISNASVALSDANGDVYTETAGGAKVNANASNDISTTYVDAKVQFRIDYAGSATSASEVLALWNEAAGDTFKVTIADTTGYTGTAPSAVIVAYYGGAGSSGVLGTNYGLKFRTADVSRSSNGWTNAGSGTHSANSLDSATFSLDNPGTFTAGSGDVDFTVTCAVKATFHVGIVGIDGVEQTSSDAYSFDISVSGGGIA